MAYGEVDKGSEEAGVDEPRGQPSGSDPPSRYEPPPAFAPRVYRVAAINETQVLGATTYPPAPDAPGYSYPPPVSWQPSPTASFAPQHELRPEQRSEQQTAYHHRGARRRRIVSIVLASAVVVSLVTIAAVLLVGSGPFGSGKHRPRSLSLPDSVDDYTLIGTISGAQLSSQFAASGVTFGGVPTNDLATAKVAIYSERSQSDVHLVFIGLTADESPSIGPQLRSESAGSVTAGVLDGAGSGSPQSADAGPLGGALQFAEVDLGGQPASAGVWADRDTLGIVLVIDATGSESSAAAVEVLTRDFRARAEH